MSALSVLPGDEEVGRRRPASCRKAIVIQLRVTSSPIPLHRPHRPHPTTPSSLEREQTARTSRSSGALRPVSGVLLALRPINVVLLSLNPISVVLLAVCPINMVLPAEETRPMTGERGTHSVPLAATFRPAWPIGESPAGS